MRETAGLYPLGVLAICLLLSIDFLSVLARFLVQQNATLADVLGLLLYRTPWFLHLAMPVAIVFAVLLAAGRMAKDSELKAAYAMGVSPATLLWPLVGLGLALGALSLVNNGFLEARGEAAYQRRIDAFIYVRPPSEVRVNAAYRIDESVYYAARVRADPSDPSLANLDGVIVQLPDGTLYAARSGTWDAATRTWTLLAGQVAGAEGAPAAVTDVVLPFALESLPSETLVRTTELPVDQLYRHLRQVAAAGGATRDLSFELHRKLADAFSTAIFAAFAGAVALRVRGRAAGFAWTIVLLVAFWAVWILAGNLFESGALGPLAAAWLTPVLAGAGAALLAARTLRA